MTPVVLVVPGRIEARTGGTIYDRRIVRGLQKRAWRVDVLELDDSFPYPTAHARAQADAAFAGIASGSVVIVDSLALGALPDLIMRETERVRIVALMHQPLSAAIGLEPAVATHFAEAERRALRAAALVVVTGQATRALLAPYDVSADRLVVVEPGTDVPVGACTVVQDGHSETAARAGNRVELLSVGAVHPGKGHDLVLESLASVQSRSWHLTCAGSLTRDPATADRLREFAATLDIADRVSFLGDLDRQELADCYVAADVFVLATRQETYGMAVAEALAHGLPVVATTTGAIPDLVGDEAGILVSVDDKAALIGALSRILKDAALRARLADGACRVRSRLPTWDAACERMSHALSALTAHG